jgi:hypothetical protein
MTNVRNYVGVDVSNKTLDAFDTSRKWNVFTQKD